MDADLRSCRPNVGCMQTRAMNLVRASRSEPPAGEGGRHRTLGVRLGSSLGPTFRWDALPLRLITPSLDEMVYVAVLASLGAMRGACGALVGACLPRSR